MLDRALALRGQGPYALQAEIAELHTEDPTDWSRIATLYDELARVAPSPVIELNRAIALAEVRGPQVGLELLDRLELEDFITYTPHEASCCAALRAPRKLARPTAVPSRWSRQIPSGVCWRGGLRNYVSDLVPEGPGPKLGDMSTATDQLISAVDFVGIPTRDLARAVDFYGETLGLPRSVYMPERNFAEFETGNLTLNIMNAEKMGSSTTPFATRRLARRRRSGRASDARGPRRDVRGRDIRHRRLPHGVLPGSGWQLADAPPPLPATRDRVVSRTHPGRAGN